MASGKSAHMEAPGGLGAHSSASALGMLYPHSSHRERCGADNDGDCQLHGAVHRLIPSMVSAAKPLPNFDFMRHSPYIAAPLSAKPIYTHIRISEGDPVDAQFDEMTAICVTSHRESSSRSDR